MAILSQNILSQPCMVAYASKSSFWKYEDSKIKVQSQPQAKVRDPFW
jgi:hypothetical protein